MEIRKTTQKEEIMVLDRGQNMDDPIIMIAFCCAAMIIPFRYY
jgi:hypothetical protein